LPKALTVLGAAATVLAAAAAQPDRSAADAPRPARQIAIERAIRQCVNRERDARGIAPLVIDADLARAARVHVRSMARGGFVDHEDQAGRGPADRVALFTERFAGAVGENVAGGYPSARSACAGWMASPGHRANFLDPQYTHIGTGFAAGGRWRRSYVQVFGIEPADPGDEEPAFIDAEPAEPAGGDPAESG